MSAPRTGLGAGFAALAKAAVLVVGVPLALARLWFVAPLPHHLLGLAAMRSVSTWAHLIIALVAIVWALAAANLVRDVWGALRRRETIDTSSWSARWATAIAGLVLVATAGTSLAASTSTHLAPAPVAAAPARPRVRPSPAATGQPIHRIRPTAIVGERECLADVAARTTGCVDDWPLLAHMNLGHLQSDGTRMLDPARLRPGWRLDLPDGSGEPTSVVPAVRAASPTAVPLDRRLSELALVGLGVVTTCALARRVRNLRRAVSSARRLGERRACAPPPLGETRAALEPFAEAPLVDWIDFANRLLWRLVRDEDTEPPDVRLVRAGPDGIEFLLAEPRPQAPWPFLARRAGHWWVLDPAVEPADLRLSAAEACRFVQPLVPLGDDERASYLLAVGRGRRLGIDGGGELVDRTLDAIVASLRTVPWAEELEVELVGIDPPPADERCYQLSSSTTAVLESLASETNAATASRLVDRWRREPLIVVGRAATGPECERVLAAATAVAGIVAAGGRGTERLVVGTDHAVLWPYGIELRRVTPSPGQSALLDGLLAEARRPAVVVPIRPGIATDRARLRAVPVAGAIEVRILRREPLVLGLHRELSDRDAARVIELLVYLALHSGKAPSEEVANALFSRSERAVRRARADNVISAARAALGPGPGGRALIARQHDEIVLDPSVTCDAVRARRAFASAPFAEPAIAEDLLVGALQLVEGPPLADIAAGYAWFAAEALDEQLAAEIIDSSHHLAALALASDRIDLARWAIGRGRLADASSEILARDLMTVARAENDDAAVRQAFSELERALERLGAGEPSLETRALLEALDAPRSCRR
jgi:DNA-binding SARP family transcriptional activator